MQFLRKPHNQWGWVRLTGCAVLAGIVFWTLLSAALRQVGEVAWLAWSGYSTFSLVDGLELAAIPLLVLVVAEWLEEQDLKTETEQSLSREAERAATEQHKETLKRFQEAVAHLEAAAHAEPVGARIAEITRAALEELDGKGKGKLLHFLFGKGLLSGEKPVVELAGADFSGAASHAQFQGIWLELVDLRNAQMDNTHLEQGHFTEANLSRARLRHAVLREAVLRGANLFRANLESADLEGADLQDANLENTFLRNANLKNCALNNLPGTGVPTGQADMRGGMDRLEAAILIDTVLPDGRKVTNEKGKEYLRNKEIAILIDRL